MLNRPRGVSNPKRRLWGDDCPLYFASLKATLLPLVRYTGSPQHKRHPGDFGLTPPAAPRQHATLCDEAAIRHHEEALTLLRSGILAGLFSQQMRGDFPSQIWAVSDESVVFEAQLENEALGQYHGYPLTQEDPFRLVVLDRGGR